MQQKGLGIRPVRVEDAEAINAMRRQESVIAMTGRLSSERLQQTKDFISNLKGDDHAWVAEIDNLAVGLGVLSVRGGKQRHVGILGLTVAEAYRRKGIGRALMEEAIKTADSQLALARLELHVLPENKAAIQLYESLGFSLEGRMRRAFIYQGRQSDLLLMSRIREG